MGTEVDSLEIAVKTTADEANKSLDALIKKLGLVAEGISAMTKDSGLSDFAKKISGLAQSGDFTKGMSSMKNVKSASSAGDKVGKAYADSIIKGYKIKDKEIQSRIREMTQTLAKMSVGEIASGMDNPEYLNKFNDLGKVVRENGLVLKESSGQYESFYEAFKNLGKIKIPKNVFEEYKDDFKSLSALAGRGKFSLKDGMPLDQAYTSVLVPESGGMLREAIKEQEQFANIINALQERKAEMQKAISLNAPGSSGFEDAMWDDLYNGLTEMRRKITEQMSGLASDIGKTAEEIRQQYAELGKGFTMTGSENQIQRKIDSLTNSLENAKLKQQELEASGNTGGKSYETAVANVVKYENQIESLKAQLESLKNVEESVIPQSKDDVFSGTISYYDDVEKGIENAQKKVEVSTSSMQYNAEAMAQTFGESAANIRDWAQAVSEIGSDAGKILNTPEMFKSQAEGLKETANAMKDFQEKLSNLVVPEIHIDSLDNLQKEMQRTEDKLEELRAKLANGITMGTVTESIDNSGYVRMQTEIALAEKKAEALRSKIEEVKAATDGIKPQVNIFNLLKGTLVNAAIAAGKLAKTLRSGITNSFSGLSKSTRQHTNSLAKNLFTIIRYTVGIRSLYMLVRKLRTAFVAGMNNLVQYSQETNASVSLLWNSMNQLKNSVAAAASPLVNALAPALNAIIQLCINAANAVNQLLSALTGHGTWIKAKKLTDDYSKSLGGASKAADDLKTHTLGIDELNVVDRNQNGSGSSGSGGASAKDMFETVDIENKFQNLADQIKRQWDMGDFTQLGSSVGQWVKNGLDSIDWRGIQEQSKKIASSIGTFINGFVETEGLGETLGETLGEAINTAVGSANTFLDATHFSSIGKFLGDGLNGLIDTVDWQEFGRAFANAINAAVETALNFGKTINWVKIGSAFASAVNQFFATFDSAKLAKGIKTWVNGIQKAIKTAFDKIKWSRVFKSLTDFTSNLDLSSAFVVAIPVIASFANALKAIGVASFIKQYNELKATLALVSGTFVGNVAATQQLSKAFPTLSSAVSVLGTSFQQLMYGVSIGDWAGGVKLSFSNITNSLSTLSKALIGGGGILADFMLVKSGFNELALGSDNLVASIGKIAGGVAVAVAALKLIGLSNPFTALIVGATTLAGAIVGINSAFNELNAERVGQTISDALTKPGGTPLKDIVQSTKDELSSIGDGFDSVSNHIKDFEYAKIPIQNVLAEVDRIKTSMDAGVIGTEDGIAQLKNAYQDLVDAAKLRFQEYETLVFTTFSSGSEASKAFEAAGLDIEAYKERVTGFSSEAQAKIQELVDEITNYASTDPTNPRMAEAQGELAGLLGVTDDLTKSMGDFETYISANPIDWASYINDGTLDVDAVNTDLESLFTKAEETQEKASDALQGIVNAAKDAGDEQNYQALKTALPSAIDAANQDAAAKVKEQTDLIQLQLLDVISNSISDAQTNWSEMSSIEKWLKWDSNEDAYIFNYVNTVKTNTIDPMSNTIESGLEQLGIDGGGWATSAAEKMISSLFDRVLSYTDENDPVMTTTLKDDWQNILTNALDGASKAVDAEKYGKDTVDGFNNGINNNADSTKSSIQEWMNSIDTSIHDSALDFGSPSKKAEEYGQWVIDGFNTGIANNTASSVSAIQNWISTVTNSVTKDKWASMFAGLVDGFKKKWNETASWWQGTAMPSFFATDVSPWFTQEKWRATTDGMKTGIISKWDEFVLQWKTKINSWWESNVKPWFTVTRWREQGENIRSSLKEKWDEFQTQWATDITSWITSNVEPYFTKERWSSYGTQMKDGMYEGFVGIAGQVQSVIVAMINAMNTAMNRIKNSVNDMIDDYNRAIRDMEDGNGETGHISFDDINDMIDMDLPGYASGGFPEDGVFFANHNELVGKFTNGQTAVANNEQIVAGIAAGVKSAVAEVLAPYLSQIADNTRETASKNTSISLDGRELVSAINDRSRRNGFSFT